MAAFEPPTPLKKTNPREAASMLDSLNLSTPAALRDATQEELAGQNLSGYEAMRRIRDDAAQFRRDYQNWRKGGKTGAKGARGITTQAHESMSIAHNPLTELTKHTKAYPLCRKNLAKIAAVGKLKVPSSPSAPKPTAFLAHLGVGGFHRSHQAYVTDVLLERATTRSVPAGYDNARRVSYKQLPGSGGDLTELAYVWGILGVGLMPWDKKMYDTLKRQDYLYTLLTRGNDGSEARVVQSIVGFLHVPEDPENALVRLEQSDIRILSLTVTEKGYYRTPDGGLDVDNALVKEDLTGWTPRGLLQPKTAPGLICTVLLRRRGQAGPLTVMSCDNLPLNGNTARDSVLAFAKLVDEDLASYIAEEVPFPNAMVDRITPVTKPEQIAILKDEYGVEDGWPVVAEPFLQWVVEDKFVCGRPAWEKACSGPNESVLFVDDVEPYELMKLRLLNSSHSAMAYVSLLASHTFVDEALTDIDVLTFLRAYMNEVVTTLVPVAGVNFIEYRAKLVERFSNPYIKDTLARLALDGSQKFEATLGHALVKHFKGNANAKIDVMALAFAAFLRCCCSGHHEYEVIAPSPDVTVEDPQIATLEPLATQALKCSVEEHHASEALDVDASNEWRQKGEQATSSFLACVFGKGVEDFSALSALVYKHFSALVFRGMRSCLDAYRKEQLLKIKAEVAATYEVLRTLQRQEILLTPPEECGETTVGASGM